MLYGGLSAVGQQLKEHHYRFTTPTPSSHLRNLQKLPSLLPYSSTSSSSSSSSPSPSPSFNGDITCEKLRHIFGWNITVKEDDLSYYLDESILTPLSANGLIRKKDKEVQSAIRFSHYSSVHGRSYLFSHSSFPTTEEDAIFFGPDTYRFFNFLSHSLPLLAHRPQITRVVDVGAGSGAGGIFVGGELQRIKQERKEAGDIEVVLLDINSKALSFSRANVAINFDEASNNPKFQYVESNLFNNVDGDFDLIISNPPYMVDTESKSIQQKEGNSRVYRDGGGALGIDLALKIVQQGILRLRVHGFIALYTGVPILAGGSDPFYEQYEEIDVDVWGEELDTKAYALAERIAVFGIIIQRKE